MGIHKLGTFGTPRIISLYLINSEKNILIESGPYSISNSLLNEIIKIGINLDEIHYIFLTHIHIDHAGGAWELLNRMPKAKVLVHESGVKHLINPTVLKSSASTVLGRELKTWGEMNPIEKQKLVPVKNGMVINLGGHKLRIFPAIGHSYHHLCAFEEHDKVLFSGDALGMYFPENEMIIPSTPPTSFNPITAIKTVIFLDALKPKTIMFSHYGTTKNVDNIFKRNVELLDIWKEIIGRQIKKGHNPEEIVKYLISEFNLDRLPTFEMKKIKSIMKINVSGYLSYFKKKNNGKR